MPRSAIDQGLAAAGSMLGGFVLGATASAVFETLPRSASGALLRLAGFGAAGTRASEFLGDETPLAPTESTTAQGWVDAGLDVLAGIVLSRLVTSNRGVLAKAAATGGVALSVATEANDSITSRTDSPDAQYLSTSLGVAMAANAAVGVGAAAIRGGGLVARRFGNTRPGRVGLSAAGSAAIAGVAYVGARIATGKAFGKIARGNKATEVAFSSPPSGTTVSGGPASQVDFTTLGLQGRRFVLSCSTSEDIKSVTGHEPVADPVRVYIGVDSYSTIDQRVDAAISELERLGGFGRSVVVAACPAGTGYVNYIPVEAAEYMTRGDCATVAIQYGSLPSMLSLNRLSYATETYAALLGRLRTEIDERQLGTTLVAYGESLGALAGQSGMLAAADDGALPVDRALWVGTPAGSALFDALTDEGTPVFDSPADLDGIDRPVSFLNHRNDPVTLTTVSLLYRMPSWMEPSDRGRGTNPAQRWFPVVSFFQGLIDTKNAATVVPGEFMSTGHDYRADLAALVRHSFAFSHVGDDELSVIDAALRRSEVTRSQEIALGKIQSA